MENIYIDDIISEIPLKKIKESNKVTDSYLLFQKQRASLLAL